MARPAIVDPPKQEVGMVAKEIAAKVLRLIRPSTRHRTTCRPSI
jgi:hypothetical protein